MDLPVKDGLLVYQNLFFSCPPKGIASMTKWMLRIAGSRLIICSVFSITEADNLVNIIKKKGL
jgi:hypothetical protein